MGSLEGLPEPALRRVLGALPRRSLGRLCRTSRALRLSAAAVLVRAATRVSIRPGLRAGGVEGAAYSFQLGGETAELWVRAAADGSAAGPGDRLAFLRRVLAAGTRPTSLEIFVQDALGRLSGEGVRWVVGLTDLTALLASERVVLRCLRMEGFSLEDGLAERYAGDLSGLLRSQTGLQTLVLTGDLYQRAAVAEMAELCPSLMVFVAGGPEPWWTFLRGCWLDHFGPRLQALLVHSCKEAEEKVAPRVLAASGAQLSYLRLYKFGSDPVHGFVRPSFDPVLHFAEPAHFSLPSPWPTQAPVRPTSGNAPPSLLWAALWDSGPVAREVEVGADAVGSLGRSWETLMGLGAGLSLVQDGPSPSFGLWEVALGLTLAPALAYFLLLPAQRRRGFLRQHFIGSGLAARLVWGLTLALFMGRSCQTELPPPPCLAWCLGQLSLAFLSRGAEELESWPWRPAVLAATAGLGLAVEAGLCAVAGTLSGARVLGLVLGGLSFAAQLQFLLAFSWEERGRSQRPSPVSLLRLCQALELLLPLPFSLLLHKRLFHQHT